MWLSEPIHRATCIKQYAAVSLVQPIVTERWPALVAGIYDTSQYACDCSPIVVPTWLDFTDMINAIPVKPNQRTAMN